VASVGDRAAPTPCPAQPDAVPLLVSGHHTTQATHFELLLELSTGLAKLQPREFQSTEEPGETEKDGAVPPPPSATAAEASRRATVAPEEPVAATAIAEGLVLEAVEGPLRGQRFPGTRPRFQIGADRNNDLQIPTDKYLFRLHARLELSQGQWMLIDQGSINCASTNPYALRMMLLVVALVAVNRPFAVGPISLGWVL